MKYKFEGRKRYKTSNHASADRYMLKKLLQVFAVVAVIIGFIVFITVFMTHQKDNDNYISRALASRMLVLLDMDMPVMDGKTFLTTRQDDPKLKSIPVIVITADDNVKAQADTINLDVEDYIVKPFVSEVVLKRVNHVLDSKKMVGRMLDEYRLDNATAVKNFQKDIKNINNYNEEITQLRNDNK